MLGLRAHARYIQKWVRTRAKKRKGTRKRQEDFMIKSAWTGAGNWREMEKHKTGLSLATARPPTTSLHRVLLQPRCGSFRYELYATVDLDEFKQKKKKKSYLYWWKTVRSGYLARLEIIFKTSIFIFLPRRARILLKKTIW